MHSYRSVICLLSIACFVVAAQAEPKEALSIKSGFFTGNSFRSLSTSAKRAYVAGFVDGAFIAPAFDAPKTEVLWLERCVTGMTDEQLVAIVDKWLSENPVRWQQSMNILAFVALKEGCQK